MLDWLESTGIARMVQESPWGYPLILSSHAVGMAILVGIVLMINFRILGFARAIPLVALRPMVKVALLGLVINVASGSMLFMAKANTFFESNPFRVKIVLLICGGVLLAVTASQCFRSSNGVLQEQTRFGATTLAGMSIIVWLGVIVSGRLIAYLDLGFY